MGFYFRKSAKLGPIRFNFSKSGIGVSAGVKGARISTGPRGTYVHAGRNGFYYRQRIGATPSREVPLQESGWVSPPHSQPLSDFVIETADVSRLTETSITELLTQINDKAAQMRFAPLAVFGSIAVAIAVWLVVLAFTAPVADFVLADRESAIGIAKFAAFLSAITVCAGADRRLIVRSLIPK